MQKQETLPEESPLIKEGEGAEALRIAEEAREKGLRHPSFGGNLFMGKFTPDMLFPFPKQSHEDRAIGDAYIEKLEAFLLKNLDPEEVDKEHAIPKEVFDGLTELGAFAMKVPKEFGGLGLSQTNYNRAVMAVASYCGATATLLSAHQSIGIAQPLLMCGSHAQKKAFLPRLREGAISAFALTEDDVGSDPAQMSTTATLSEDGSHYVLNGSKLWCTNGTIADIIVVMALTEPKIVGGKERKQISAFILEMDTPGVEVAHRCEFMGLNGIYNGVLKFKEVKIPKENLLWAEGRGLAIALSTINVGRLTLPAASAGGAKQCLSIARRWCRERIQWGKPVGSHEAGQEKLAYIASTTMAMEAVTWLSCQWAEEGKVDIRIEAAMAKLFCTEEFWKITDLTMQLRGGRGYETARSLRARGEEPFPVERAMRDCRVNRILEGTSEIMRLFLAREAIDPHIRNLKPLLDKKSSTAKKLSSVAKLFVSYSFWYSKQLWQSLFPKRHKELGKLSSHYRFIEAESHRLSRKLFGYMVKYQQGLEAKQMILARLMEIGTELFVMAATCSYALELSKKGDPSSLELADYFCRLASRRIKQRISSLKDNDDPIASKLATNLLDGHYRWLEEGIIWLGNKK